MSWNRFLATDLDGTFIGDDEAMYELWEQLERAGIELVFSTGRHLQSIEEFYARVRHWRTSRQRHPAAACVCMVGTDIYFRRADEYVLDRGWHQRIAERWDGAAVEEVMRGVPDVQMQEAQWQSDYKCSYWLEVNVAARLAEIEALLAARGLEAKVVYSADRYLDLLPIRSGKGEALRYVAEQQGVPPERVITCGDTGNDLDMMRGELGFRCIAVGNAAPELKAFRERQVYHARANFAAGILEGLRRYRWV